MKLENASPFLCAVIALNLAGAGCATKRHVRESIAQIQSQINRTQNQVNALKEQIDHNRQRIGDLDRQLATSGEKAADARTRSAEAMEAASRAIHTADAASATAQRAQRALVKVNQRIDEAFNGLDNYRLVFSEKIYFAFSQSGLAKEEQPKLNRTIRRIRGMKNYIVEIEGFADSSGDLDSNRQLSRKRADAVVHYLVVGHAVPLRSIWELGAGADFPHADNQTPSARRENRRVELKIYSLDLEPRAAAVGGSRQELRDRPFRGVLRNHPAGDH